MDGQEVTRAYENEVALLGDPTHMEGVPATGPHGACGHTRDAHSRLNCLLLGGATSKQARFLPLPMKENLPLFFSVFP